MVNKVNIWSYLKEGFLNLIYPYSCENCGKIIRESKGYAICDNCFKKIRLISTPYCYQCGKPLSPLVPFEERPLCAECSIKKKHLYFNRSVAYYQGVMRKCIHLLKYKKQVKLIQPLGQLMVDYLEYNNHYNTQEIDLIIPVPLFRDNLEERGFNQSALLAKYIANYFSIYFRDDWLIKDKKNISQVGLSKNERKNNVKDVFSIDSSISFNKRDISNVLLIDDIFTTGATIEACCREITRMGIKNIFVLTLARAD
jgi:competence protein ComFC